MIPNSLISIFCKIKHTHAKMQALNCASNLQFELHQKNYDTKVQKCIHLKNCDSKTLTIVPIFDQLKEYSFFKHEYNNLAMKASTYSADRVWCSPLLLKFKREAAEKKLLFGNTYVLVTLSASLCVSFGFLFFCFFFKCVILN